MRRLSVVVTALLIMLLGFAASLYMITDEERLKRLLAVHVENQLGRELQIEGAVSLRFFPRLEIRATSVQLSGADAFEDMDVLTSDHLSARIRLAPLLRGQVQAAEVSVQGARLNLLFDEEGRHSASGLLHHRQRKDSPGILVNGPLRLENLALQISRLGTEALQQISVERMELDGLALDQALSLVFEGAIGIPTLVEDVTVNGVLFVPAGGGAFRLSGMVMEGRARGARSAFELTGDLDFSARPPLEMELRNGLLSIDGHQARIGGRYEARARPYFSLEVTADTLDPRRLVGALFGWAGLTNEFPLLAGWTALHDYDLSIQADALQLGVWPLSHAVLRIAAQGGLAEIQDARAGFPGGTLEVLGDLTATSDASLVSMQARIEIDQLASTLAAAASPLGADGVGQVLLEPSDDGLDAGVVQGSLRFFDGFVIGLDGLRASLGANPGNDFDVLEGSFVLRENRIDFPDLQVVRDDERLEFSSLSLEDFLGLSGQALLSGDNEDERVVTSLSGTLHQPQFVRVNGPDPAQ